MLTYHQEHRRTFDDEVVRWLAPALLYMGAEWDMWRNLAIARIEGWVKSAHPEVRARQRALFPSSRTKVPANVEYFAHRHHEFILLSARHWTALQPLPPRQAPVRCCSVTTGEAAVDPSAPPVALCVSRCGSCHWYWYMPLGSYSRAEAALSFSSPAPALLPP